MKTSRWSITLEAKEGVKLISEHEQALPHDGIRVAPRWCGVCGTDLDIVRRNRRDRPSILGHEAYVQVIEKGVDADWRGPPVIGGVINPVSSIDQNRNIGHSVPGIWSTSRIITSDEIRHGHLIDWAGLAPGPEAALAEPLAAVLYADEVIRRVSLKDGTLLLVGSGSFATLAALYFLRLGLRCTITGSSRKHLNDLERKIDSPNLTAIERGKSLPQQQFDAVLVAVPRAISEAAIDIAFAHVRNEGVVDLVGAPQGRYFYLDEIRRANVRGVPPIGVSRSTTGPNGDIRVTGHRGTGTGHVLQAIDLLQRYPTWWQKAVTHVLPLAEAPAVITAVARNRAALIDGRGVGKAIIDMSR